MDKEYWRAYYQRNKERIKARATEHQRVHAAERKVYLREYNERNRVALQTKGRQFRLRNAVQIAARKKRYAEANPEKLKAGQRAYRIKNRAMLILKDKAKYQRRKEQVKVSGRDYRRRNREKLNAAQRARNLARYNSDPDFRLRGLLRCRMKHAIKGRNKSASAIKLLGCSIEDFRIYIESKFESGMTWKDVMMGRVHIDHIVPVAIFDLAKPDHQKRCFHFSNMQPMWALENIQKGAKLKEPQLPLALGILPV